jgi:hypothetical protein
MAQQADTLAGGFDDRDDIVVFLFERVGVRVAAGGQ